MTDKVPYVHNYILTLDKMPMLANGSNAAVFLTISLLEPAHPQGVSEQVIANYTGKGIATVKTALANLQSSAMVETVTEGLYLTNAAYAKWGKRQCDVEGRTKNFFCTHDDDVQKDDTSFNSSFNHPFIHETAEILQAAGIEGANVERLSVKVSPFTAKLWADWLEYVDRERWRNPEGYCFSKLNVDPLSKPPYVKKPQVEEARDYHKSPVVTGRLAEKIAAQRMNP